MKKFSRNSGLSLDYVLPDGGTVRASAEARIAATPFLDGGNGVTRRGLIAQSVGLRQYEEYCDTHGVTLFDVATMRCALCLPLRDARLSRAEARKAGLTSFASTCPTHGETAHSVAHGKCLSCFTTAGAARVTLRPAPNNPRSQARRAGAARYMSECPTHGKTVHSVAHGKCLACFTSQGVPRAQGAQGRPLTDGVRASARRAGLRTYSGVCHTHGETAHSISHGKCLACFTVAGVRRAVPLDATVKPA